MATEAQTLLREGFLMRINKKGTSKKQIEAYMTSITAHYGQEIADKSLAHAKRYYRILSIGILARSLDHVLDRSYADDLAALRRTMLGKRFGGSVAA